MTEPLKEIESPLHNNEELVNPFNEEELVNPFIISDDQTSEQSHNITIEADKDIDLSSTSNNNKAKKPDNEANSSSSPSKNKESNSSSKKQGHKINLQPSTNNGSSNSSSSNNIQSSSNNQQSKIFSTNTLDEPVSETILRDLKNVAIKLQQVLNPFGKKNVLRDWDLWGPLILCLALAILLTINAPQDQQIIVFTGVFVIVWCGSAIVTINAKLLGGAVSFFQSVCILGYCIFPLVIVAIVAIFVKAFFIRLPLVIFAFAWSSYASVSFLSAVHLTKRRALAVYPLILFYFIISWMILISN